MFTNKSEIMYLQSLYILFVCNVLTNQKRKEKNTGIKLNNGNMYFRFFQCFEDARG